MKVASRLASALVIVRFLAVGSMALLMFGTASAQTPPVKAEAPVLKVGDRWKLETKDRRTGVKEADWALAVVAVSATQIEMSENDGKLLMTPELNVIDSPRVSISGESKTLSFPLEVGKKWDYKYSFKSKVGGNSGRWQVEANVVAYEKVKVAAGEFDAFKIQAKGYWNNETTGRNGRLQQISWYSPAARAIVKTEYEDGFNNTIRELTEIQLQP